MLKDCSSIRLTKNKNMNLLLTKHLTQIDLFLVL